MRGRTAAEDTPSILLVDVSCRDEPTICQAVGDPTAALGGVSPGGNDMSSRTILLWYRCISISTIYSTIKGIHPVCFHF